MIPYLPHPKIMVFGQTFTAFGFLVTSGIMLGIYVYFRLNEKAGIDKAVTKKAVRYALFFGFVLSHLVNFIVYHPDRMAGKTLIEWVNVFDGMSSTGGFLGAAIGLAVVFRSIRENRWMIADHIMIGLIVAWTLARLGCTLAHDHIGTSSHFVLAVQYPDGARHNTGLYEFLFTALVLLPVAITLYRRKAKPGAQVMVASILYGLFRFPLDFLRATDLPGSDPRFFGLTFAQYACIIIIGIGIYLVKRKSPAA